MEWGGFDNLADWSMAVAERNRAANPNSDSLECYDYAVLWHLATGTPYVEMEAEMKALRYRSKEQYLDRVIMTRFQQLHKEQQAVVDAAVEGILSL